MLAGGLAEGASDVSGESGFGRSPEASAIRFLRSAVKLPQFNIAVNKEYFRLRKSAYYIYHRSGFDWLKRERLCANRCADFAEKINAKKVKLRLF